MRLASIVTAATMVVVALVSPASPEAPKLPSEFGYTVYVEGQPAGNCETKVTESEEGYVLASHVVISRDEFQLDIDTVTKADRATLLPYSFEYVGTRRGQPVEGSVVIDGTEVTCTVVENGEPTVRIRESRNPRLLLLEDYVMDHEVLIALAFARAGSDPAEFGLFFPSACNVSGLTVTKGSDLAIESETEEAICEKLVVLVEGSSAFASYYDPARGLPVYLAFPSTATEVFLNEFFGDQPVSRYRTRSQ